MTPKEAIAVLVAAFSREKIEHATVSLYVKKLHDIHGDVLEATVNRLVDTAKFFPSIAEIRETAAHLCGCLPASPAEALAIIRRASVAEPKCDRSGKYIYTEYHWDWPQMSESTMGAVFSCLQQCGDPVDGNGKEKFGWEMGFSKTYETLHAEYTRKALSDLSQVSLPPHARKGLQTSATATPIASGSTGIGVGKRSLPSGPSDHDNPV